jgi:DNA (cytosine-5)-methyltransferase 1
VRVIELFAGVGGFRVGLESASSEFEIVWSNQWEPGCKKQYASQVYIRNFGDEGHANKDIALVNGNDIPQCDILTAGFPCQDYSVAKNINLSRGIQGKKGVLWWEIYRLLSEMKQKPSILILENVDRLIKSPVNQRGRDFGIILASLNDLGYAVEWRIIDASAYGMPQKRKRIYIMAYLKGSVLYEKMVKNPKDWCSTIGILASGFPLQVDNFGSPFELNGQLHEVSNNFLFKFYNCGFCVNKLGFTFDVKAAYNGGRIVLGDVLVPSAAEEFYINDSQLPKWEFLKGAKRIPRVKAGVPYVFAEGKMTFPDDINKPSRTIITAEGGPSPSRFKHVVQAGGRYRRLTPVELERLNMFPDDFTAGVPDVKRAFLMGNALVCGIVQKIGEEISQQIVGV